MANLEDKTLDTLQLARKARQILLENLPEMIEEIDLIMAEAVSRLEAGTLDPLQAVRYVGEIAGLIRFTRRLQSRMRAGERIDKKRMTR